MQFDINTVISMAAVIVAFYVGFRANRNGDKSVRLEEAERSKEQGKVQGQHEEALRQIMEKLDSIATDIAEIKIENKTFATKLAQIEAGTKSAHKRLDAFENRTEIKFSSLENELNEIRKGVADNDREK